MYLTVTAERSLFFVEEHHVENFKKMAKKMENFITLSQTGALNLEETWLTAFNIWVLLQPDDELIIQSFDKTLYYSTNHIIITALTNDYQFNFIRTHPKSTPELIYTATIFLTMALNSWYLKLLTDNHLNDIAERMLHQIYFESHLGEEDMVHLFINDQARVVKVLVYELSHANTFERIIKSACDDARFIYNDTFQSRQINNSILSKSPL
ncbi:hypothetical protein [Solibacillus sp. FSL K6-1523]|uniref:hypothetical protein n=1 Tax=Solibacillus sp. FSL K6-1523 TaxID=2921471 RepID=UPI0030F73BC6